MATVKELRAQAKALGIKGYSRMRKAELEAVLSDAQAVVQEVQAKAQEVAEIRERLKSISHTSVELKSLRGAKSYEEFKARQAENVAVIMKCETLSELKALLEPLDTRSMWASARVAMLAICGDAPDLMIGGSRNCASLIMQARAHARAKSF